MLHTIYLTGWLTISKKIDSIIKELKALPFTNFQKSVLLSLIYIPKGKVSTYGELARFVGIPRGARAVGNALNINPFDPYIPCHRIVASNGGIGGFATGPIKKSKLLKKEGVIVEKGKIKNFNEKYYEFTKKDYSKLKKQLKY